MTTLYSSVIKLSSLHPVALIGDGGQHAHGAFHAIIAKVDPDLATRLHEIRGRKPFTLSPLMGLPKFLHRDAVQDRNGNMRRTVYLREGWQCWLRITILNDMLFKTFIDYFMNMNGGKLPEI